MEDELPNRFRSSVYSNPLELQLLPACLPIYGELEHGEEKNLSREQKRGRVRGGWVQVRARVQLCGQDPAGKFNTTNKKKPAGVQQLLAPHHARGTMCAVETGTLFGCRKVIVLVVYCYSWLASD